MSSSKNIPSSTVGASVMTFRGSTSHDFMIWLAEWKKYLVYQGIHDIILDGTDGQGQEYDASVNFKIFEPEFYMRFYNNEIINSQREEEELVRGQIITEWPWLVAYLGRKHLTFDQVIAEGAKRCNTIPSKADLLYCLEEFNLISPGSGDLPYPTIQLARSPAQMTDRNTIITAAGNGDQNAINELAQSTHIEYVPAEKRMKVNYMDVSVIIKKITKQRLLNRQIKNDAELDTDIQIASIERGDPQDNRDWSKYITTRLGFQKPAYEAKLNQAREENQKRSLKHSDQSKKCLDALALLGDIKCIPEAEVAISNRHFHECFLAVDHHYMCLGGQDTALFRNEVESYYIQPGQDLNSHLDLLQHAIERWLNIELMESKLLELGSATKMSASKFVLDHPEVAYNNSYDMTDAEILAQKKPTVILLSEAKRFTIYSNSVKSSPRFKRIVEEFHSRDESLRTVRSLLAAIRNFEISNSGRDQITEERRQNSDWRKDLQSYLTIVQKRDLDPSIIKSPTQEKSASFTSTDRAATTRSRGDTEKSDTGSSRPSRSQTDPDRSSSGESHQPRNASEVRDGDIPKCSNHPSSKTHWTWECKGGKAQGNTPKNKARSETTSTGCIFCFKNPRLRKNSLNHNSSDCRSNPDNRSTSSSANQASLRAMIREVLNEPADKKRSREESEEIFYPGRPLGSDPNDFDMDSSTDSNDQPKSNKKKGKK